MDKGPVSRVAWRGVAPGDLRWTVKEFTIPLAYLGRCANYGEALKLIRDT